MTWLSSLLALFAAVLVASGIAFASGGENRSHAASSATCGVERWPVKPLSDSRVGQVNFTPHTTNVSVLRSKPVPQHIGSTTPRIDGVETTTYKVHAKLIEYALEDDHDIHLVISTLSNRAKTMIVEFPDTTCPGASTSPKKQQMRQARTALIAACGAPSTHFQDLTGDATFTGVGFFDVKHHQNGLAPNGIELHPVLSVSGASCHRT